MKVVGLFLWRITVDNVIIFGCGPTGLRTYEELKGENNIIAFLDNDEQKVGTAIEGIPVYKPQENLLIDKDYNYIVIASVYGKWQIKEQLNKLGIKDGKIRFHSKGSNILLPFLKNLSEDFKEANITGMCAEVGVFRGESACLINKFFPDRELHLYDTFEGFAQIDIEYEHLVGRKDAVAGQFSDTSIELVMKNMVYPEKVIIHKGYFPDTAKGLNIQFCFVRIDLDLYVPTEAALDIFVPLMVPGGVILVHDYFGNQYPGIKKVVKKFVGQYPGLHKVPIGDAMSIAIVGF